PNSVWERWLGNSVSRNGVSGERFPNRVWEPGLLQSRSCPRCLTVGKKKRRSGATPPLYGETAEGTAGLGVVAVVAWLCRSILLGLCFDPVTFAQPTAQVN